MRLSGVVAACLCVSVVCLLGGCQDKVVYAATVPKSVAEAPASRRYSMLIAAGSPSQAARDVLTAMDLGDAKALLRFASPDEIKELDLTEQKLAAFLAFYHRERTNFVNHGISECRESRDGTSQCTALLTRNRYEIVQACTVYPSADGPRTCVTTTILSALLQLRLYQAARAHIVDDSPPYEPGHIMSALYSDLEVALGPSGYKGLLFVTNNQGGVRFAEWSLLQRSLKHRFSGHVGSMGGR